MSDRVAKILKAIVLVAGIAVLTGSATYFFYCPCQRTPGGWLLGPESNDTVSDWSFANDAGLCQIQVSGPLPHSVNLNCMASEGALFLSCARCSGKTWSTYALAEPNGRIRIDGTVYPIILRRVTDPNELDRAWVARAAKQGRPAGPRQEGWWSFAVTSR